MPYLPRRSLSCFRWRVPLQVLDDVLVKWSNLTHTFGLQLVRWTTLEYFVVMPLDLSEKKRPLVRAMADTLMAMTEEFRCDSRLCARVSGRGWAAASAAQKVLSLLV